MGEKGFKMIHLEGRGGRDREGGIEKEGGGGSSRHEMTHVKKERRKERKREDEGEVKG